MKKDTTVLDYIEKHQTYMKELVLLRDILNNTDLEETIKWGAPCYTINGKNIVGMAAFKSYIGLWFHQGVFLKDLKKVLINAQEGTTKALRQWRFKNIDEMDPKLIKEYVDEAIQNQKAGKEMKAVKAKSVETPSELNIALSKNIELKKLFKSLTAGRQREYSEYIGSAKQEKTRQIRLEKCIPLILNGKGLNDKYKK